MRTTAYVMMNLLAGLYWFDEALQRSFEEHGLDPHPRQYSLVLMNLAIGETRPSRLARNLGITRQAVSQLMAQMKRRGLVTVRRDPADQRALIIAPSPEAATLRNTAMAILGHIEAILGERIGVDKLDAMRAALSLDWGAPPVDVRLEKVPAKPGKPRAPQKAKARGKRK
jgi:DNA-binding MarR family transcriptional regulator